MKKLAYLIVILTVGVTSVYAFREQLRDAAIEYHGRRMVGQDWKRAWLTDGKLHVITVGTGQPRADATRAQACVAVIAGGEFVMFDAGAGSSIAAELQNLPVDALKGIFLTHFHSDHIADLPMMANQSWRKGRKSPLLVFGPTGVDRVVDGFNRAFSLDVHYRAENHAGDIHAASMLAREITAPSPGQSVVVYRSESGLVVRAFRVDHAPVDPAFGYRVEYRGRSVVISGDTRKSESLAQNAKGTDILIHEAYNKELVKRFIRLTAEEARRNNNRELLTMNATATRVMDYHASPRDAAEIAAGAGVGKLVYYHIIPPLGPSYARALVTEPLFLRGAKDVFSGEIVMAEDGDHFELEPR